MATLAMPVLAFIKERQSTFEELLFEICEALQITSTQHQKAKDRYKTIGKVITAFPGFAGLAPEIYSQGSMKLRTTTKPVGGPLIWTLYVVHHQSQAPKSARTVRRNVQGLQDLFYLREHGRKEEQVH